MEIDMGILQVFDLIFYPIEKLIDLLKSQEISNYLFSGSMTLYSFIIVLICVFLVSRFALKPVALRARFDSPVESSEYQAPYQAPSDLPDYITSSRGYAVWVRSHHG